MDMHSFRESVDCYHDNEYLLVYGHPRKGYSGKEIIKILLNPTFQDELLCSTHPVSVQNNVSFVVDLSKLKDPNDVHADDLGTWKCTASVYGQNNQHCCIGNDTSTDAEVVYVQHQYHVHATDPDLHRMIA